MKALYLILIVLIISSASAKIDDCGEVAQYKAKELRMDIVWVQYLSQNGAYIFDGKKGAHILNSKEIKGKRYYFDFSMQSYASVIFNSKEEVSQFYKSTTGYNNEVYIIGVDNIPFKYYLN